MTSPLEETPKMEIDLLGPMRVTIEGSPMGQVRSKKVAWLLALLVFRGGRPTSRKWLAGTLWPDVDQPMALASLRPALSELRRALGASSERLKSPDRDTVLFNLEGAEVDLTRFEQAVADGDTGSLERAVGLYRGPLLEGCSEEWVYQERNVREQACVQALVTLGERLLSQGAPDGALPYFQRAIGLDPWRDAPRRGLMQAHTDAQDVNSALQAYRDFARFLSSEGGLEPDAETTELYHRLRANARKGGGEEARPSTEDVGLLPQPITPLIGREDERLEVASRLRRTRLVTLTGVGGIGKTRLALGVANDLASEYRGRVWFVALDSLFEGRSVPIAVAAALGLREEPSDALIASIANRLRQNRSLLVLDSCEHLLDATAELSAKLLRECPDLRILATSREAMSVPGEAVWPVPTLAFPVSANLPEGRATRRKVAMSYESIDLFVDRAQSVLPKFAVTDENLEVIVQICALVEGIPLAIEMAAVRLRSMPIQAVVDRLQDRLFEVLEYRRRGIPDRQETLDATLDWSYDLLSDSERRTLARLSIFVGGWPLEAAEAIVPDDRIPQVAVAELLGSLADKSLVVFDEARARYRMLEVVRQYAIRKQDADSRVATSQRHLAWCVSIAQRFEAEIVGPNQAEWLNRVDEEWPNIRAAIARDENDRESALGLASSLWQYWYRRCMLEGREWLQSALDRVPDAPAALKASALYGLGCLFYNEADFDRAARLLKKCLDLRSRVASPWDVARTLDALGNCAAAIDDYAEATDHFNRSVHIRRSIEDDIGVARTQSKISSVMYCVADYAATRRLKEESARVLGGAGDQYAILWIAMGLADVDRREGKYLEARERCLEAQAIAKELGDPLGTASCLCNLGELSLDEGDVDRAKAILTESLQLYRESGHRRMAACCATSLGQALKASGELQQAKRLQEDSVAVLRVIGDRVSTAEGLHALGCTLEAMEQGGGAEACWRESLQLRQAVGERRGIADCLDSFAMRFVSLGEFQRAARLFGAAERLREEIGAPIPPVDYAAYQTRRDLAYAALGNAEFEKSYALGWTMEWSQASAYALSDV